MDTHHLLENTREKAAGNNMVQEKPQSPVTASPPSASSSPSHEFSFTISLHHSSSASIPDHSNKNNNKAKTTPSFAIDLSPADDIFFHGHLLPLQFLSHLPVSPRSSTNSLDSFTLPIRDLVDDQEPTKERNNCSTSIDSNNIIINKKKSNSSSNIQDSKQHSQNGETRGRTKSKSFSIFGLQKKRKDSEQREDKEGKQKKNKMRFDVSNILKRYVRMVRPLMFFRGRKENVHFSRQPHSFSGNLNPRNRHHLMRGMRGEFSAPASMRTSPTNSGLLLATSGASTPPTNTSESTMEELQAAIQAAIAHCKNSFATEEKIKCLE
ncbi:BRI1 kinase inhibitor 1 [Argentina anserina]|uniref:BRI1 kinase inhibitor 1 n=1 Tax=Argentina anserina TaxID=57926 RepID=UPI00217646A4|nr:BRI1 kinase inhibitor 1 [Potentilla anserina]